MMKFAYSIMYVLDVQKALNFYQAVCGLEVRFLHESQQYAEMHTGGTTLAFVSEAFMESQSMVFRPNRQNEVPGGYEISFVTDDIDGACKAALAAGALVVHPPEEKPWGQRVAYVRDPNGVLVQFCTAVVSS